MLATDIFEIDCLISRTGVDIGIFICKDAFMTTPPSDISSGIIVNI